MSSFLTRFLSSSDMNALAFGWLALAGLDSASRWETFTCSCSFFWSSFGDISLVVSMEDITRTERTKGFVLCFRVKSAALTECRMCRSFPSFSKHFDKVSHMHILSIEMINGLRLAYSHGIGRSSGFGFIWKSEYDTKMPTLPLRSMSLSKVRGK